MQCSIRSRDLAGGLELERRIDLDLSEVWTPQLPEVGLNNMSLEMVNCSILSRNLSGGYFMSEQDEKAAKWQMVEDYKAANGMLETLKREAQNIGEMFTLLGNALKNHPEKIDSSSPNRILVGTLEHPVKTLVETSKISLEVILALLQDIRTTADRKKGLEDRLKANGVSLK
jgi:hypothetical protein